jgi:hypothetical protein
MRRSAHILLKRFGGSCHSFYLFCLFHTFIITVIQYIHSYAFAEAYFLSLPYSLRGKNLPVVPSRHLNSGLPYRRPAHYQLSHAAP